MSLSIGGSSRAASIGIRIWLPLIALVLLSSCDLFEDGSEPNTRIRFISFISGGPALNARISGETIQVASFVPRLTPVGPTDVPAFSTIESGRRPYQISQSGAEVVHQGSLTLADDTLYTAYLTGQTDNASLTLVGESAVRAPGQGAALRLVHAYSRAGDVEAAIYEAQASPDGGGGEGLTIAQIEDLSYGESSELVEIVEPEIAVLITAGGRQGPMLPISPVEGRLYTIVITHPSGVFGNANFGYAVYQEEL